MILILLIILVLILFAYWYFFMRMSKDEKETVKKNLFGPKENFLGTLPNFGFRTTPSFIREPREGMTFNYSDVDDFQRKLKKEMYQNPNRSVRSENQNKPIGLQNGFYSTPSFQKEISPRMTGGIDFRANLNNGVLPPSNDMAVNACGIGGSNDQCMNDSRTADNFDNPNQPVIYDRLMYSNKRTKLMEHNDMIRGSLPIMPKYGEWFRPSVDPLIDLQRGAMNILAGKNNGVSRAFDNLFGAEGVKNAIPMEMNNTTFDKKQFTPSYKTNFMSGNQDVNVVQAFP